MINQRLSAFCPAVRGLSSRVVRTVQSEVFSQFQNSGGGYIHIGGGYWLCEKNSIYVIHRYVPHNPTLIKVFGYLTGKIGGGDCKGGGGGGCEGGGIGKCEGKVEGGGN